MMQTHMEDYQTAVISYHIISNHTFAFNSNYDMLTSALITLHYNNNI